MTARFRAREVPRFAQVYGFRQFEPVVMWAAIVLIVVFVHFVQLLGNRLARRSMRR